MLREVEKIGSYSDSCRRMAVTGRGLETSSGESLFLSSDLSIFYFTNYRLSRDKLWESFGYNFGKENQSLREYCIYRE